MKIEMLTSVKDMVDGLPSSLEKGDVRTVPEKDGYRFIGHGWAKEHPNGAAEAPAEGSVDLNIHSGTLGSSDTLGA